MFAMHSAPLASSSHRPLSGGGLRISAIAAPKNCGPDRTSGPAPPLSEVKRSSICFAIAQLIHGNDHFLDVRRSFNDLVEHSVSKVARHGVFSGITIGS